LNVDIVVFRLLIYATLFHRSWRREWKGKTNGIN